MFLLCDDGLLYEVDESCVDEDESGEGVWCAFEGEDEESFYAYDDSIDPEDYE